MSQIMLPLQISKVFSSRRERLFQAHPNSVFVFPAAPHLLRNPDVHFPYRQESNFYYISGFEEPDAIVVLAEKKFILFCRERNPERELWDGERYGIERAPSVFGAD